MTPEQAVMMDLVETRVGPHVKLLHLQEIEVAIFALRWVASLFDNATVNGWTKAEMEDAIHSRLITTLSVDSVDQLQPWAEWMDAEVTAIRSMKGDARTPGFIGRLSVSDAKDRRLQGMGFRPRGLL